jgi:hypothetical protein
VKAVRVEEKAGQRRVACIALACALAAPAMTPGEARALQFEAPSGNVVSPALLDRLASPKLVSGDLDWPFEDRGEGLAFTLRGSPFGWLAPGASQDSVSGEKHERALSRLGAGFTFGGPTQTDDQIVESRHHRVSDHVTAELKLPVFGTPAVDEAPDAGATPSHRANDAGGLVALGGSLAADVYSTGFGRDLYMATLIAESSRGLPWAANFGYRAEEKVHQKRNDELKAGLGTGATWRGTLWIVQAIEGSVSGAVLVRNRSREDVWLANTRLDLPMRGHVKAVGAVTWSNSPERIRVPLVRGRLALAYEFMGRR